VDLHQLSPRELGDSNDPRAVPLLCRFLNEGTIQQRTHAASAIRKLAVNHSIVCKAAIPGLTACATRGYGRSQAQLRQYSLLALEQLDPSRMLLPLIAEVLSTEKVDYVREVAFRLQAAIDKTELAARQSGKLGSIRSSLLQYGVESFWHITHIDNLSSVLRFGIFNHNQAHEKRPTLADISDPSVQRWRDRRDPIYKRSLHEYAPLYIKPRNPMLYKRKGMVNEICLIEVSVDILAACNYLLSDGNAASAATQFFSSLAQLDRLPWTTLSSHYWSDHADGKRKMCAEVLIFPRVWPVYISATHFCREPDAGLLMPLNIPMKHSPDLFFGS